MLAVVNGRRETNIPLYLLTWLFYVKGNRSGWPCHFGQNDRDLEDNKMKERLLALAGWSLLKISSNSGWTERKRVREGLDNILGIACLESF
ncbi:MAG: hypothetical protein ACSNEK_09105 [Parachlamydiaceae bacterium]